MNDRMDSKTRGDSVLRKIDLNYDHFIAAYGPNGDGTGKAIVPVPYPQVTRRIELIAAPITPFEAAIKASGTFYGLGSAARIDSYDSSKDYNDGRPQGSYFFVANNPSDPRVSDSRSGHVQIGTAVATIMGTLYGNIATNGGTIVRSEYITGTIDNNVPFSLPPYRMPDLGIAHQSPANVTGVVNLTPTSPGTAAAPNFYTLSSYNGDLTIHPAAGASKTHVALKVQTTITGSIRVKPGVHAQVFFESDLRVKAQELINETGYAGNLQFYGVSPTNGSQQRIEISPPGNFSAVIYAPSAEYMMNGNPDITGALVCKTFYGNGNTSWHYDRALDYLGEVTDYRITSYVEDIR
jgi:hypothetical protein